MSDVRASSSGISRRPRAPTITIDTAAVTDSSIQSPITSESLAELDSPRIFNNPKLRHDVNFDRELHFRPNLDGNRGNRKLEQAQQYWRLLEAGLTTCAQTTALVDRSPAPSSRLTPPSGSRPISPEQLAAEVKDIYAGLVQVEAKCIKVDASLGAASDVCERLDSDRWQALVALHRTLLYEHHDFLMATQHPSAGEALHGLATKYNMPARMWKHGIHAFLELLRHRHPDSQEYMLGFIYLAYQMMALLSETVPAFTDTWIECLGDLARYRMAIEEGKEHRATWDGVAARWCVMASDRHPAIGRLYHHLAILERPSLRKMCLYANSLTCVIPLSNTPLSLRTMCEHIVQEAIVAQEISRSGARIRDQASSLAHTDVAALLALVFTIASPWQAHSHAVTRSVRRPHHHLGILKRRDSRPLDEGFLLRGNMWLQGYFSAGVFITPAPEDARVPNNALKLRPAIAISVERTTSPTNKPMKAAPPPSPPHPQQTICGFERVRTRNNGGTMKRPTILHTRSQEILWSDLHSAQDGGYLHSDLNTRQSFPPASDSSAVSTNHPGRMPQHQTTSGRSAVSVLWNIIAALVVMWTTLIFSPVSRYQPTNGRLRRGTFHHLASIAVLHSSVGRVLASGEPSDDITTPGPDPVKTIERWGSRSGVLGTALIALPFVILVVGISHAIWASRAVHIHAAHPRRSGYSSMLSLILSINFYIITTNHPDHVEWAYVTLSLWLAIWMNYLLPKCRQVGNKMTFLWSSLITTIVGSLVFAKYVSDHNGGGEGKLIVSLITEAIRFSPICATAGSMVFALFLRSHQRLPRRNTDGEGRPPSRG